MQQGIRPDWGFISWDIAGDNGKLREKAVKSGFHQQFWRNTTIARSADKIGVNHITI
jgi:hypothetical protein